MAVFAVIFFGAKQGEKGVEKENDRVAEIVAELDRKDALEDARAFNENSQEILARVKALYEVDKLNEAIELSAKYLASKNQELLELNKAAKIKQFTSLLYDVPESDRAMRAEIYSQLSVLDPNSENFKQRAAYYRALSVQGQR